MQRGRDPVEAVSRESRAIDDRDDAGMDDFADDVDDFLSIYPSASKHTSKPSSKPASSTSSKTHEQALPSDPGTPLATTMTGSTSSDGSPTVSPLAAGGDATVAAEKESSLPSSIGLDATESCPRPLRRCFLAPPGAADADNVITPPQPPHMTAFLAPITSKTSRSAAPSATSTISYCWATDAAADSTSTGAPAALAPLFTLADSRHTSALVLTEHSLLAGDAAGSLRCWDMRCRGAQLVDEYTPRVDPSKDVKSGLSGVSTPFSDLFADSLATSQPVRGNVRLSSTDSALQSLQPASALNPVFQLACPNQRSTARLASAWRDQRTAATADDRPATNTPDNFWALNGYVLSGSARVAHVHLSPKGLTQRPAQPAPAAAPVGENSLFVHAEHETRALSRVENGHIDGGATACALLVLCEDGALHEYNTRHQPFTLN